MENRVQTMAYGCIEERELSLRIQEIIYLVPASVGIIRIPPDPETANFFEQLAGLNLHF